MRITERRGGAVASAPLQSLAQGSMFWRPDHVEMSAWLDHLPWIFWLVEAMMPQRCVTLGARVGSPHTAFCQAISRLNLDTECLLVADGEDEEADAIHAAADRRYGAVSRRLNVVPRRGAKQLGAGSIDILALDFAPTDPDIEDVLDRWLSRVSERGVILIPGINRREPGCSAFEHFEALQVSYRSLAFHHGDGLGVLVAGERSIELLETLLERWNSSMAARTIRDVFARLGRGCADQALSELQRSRLNSVRQQVQELSEEREEHDKTLAQFQLRLQERDKQLAALESEKHALASLLEETQSGRADTKHQLAELQSRQINAETALQASEAKCQALEADITDKEANIQTRFQELATLTQVAEDKDQTLASLESALQASEAKCQALEADIADKEANIQTRFQELATLTQLAEDKDQTLASLESALQASEAKCQALEADIADKESSIQARFQEVVTLTQMAEEKDSTIEKLKRSIADFENQVSKHERELSVVHASLAETEQRRDVLESENARLAERVDELESKPGPSPSHSEVSLREQELETLLQERNDSIDTRFKELAALTELLEERDREIESLKESQSWTADKEISEQEPLSPEFASSPSSSKASSSKWPFGAFVFGNQRDKRKERRWVHRKREAAVAELKASTWFDAQWYLAQYPDIANDEKYARFPALHYLEFGGFEGRNPSPHFDSAGYLEVYPDVAITEINPLLHFIRDGIKEGREPKPKLAHD